MPTNSRKTAASKRKKQTRLAFDPLDISSPTKQGPSPAKVRFERNGLPHSPRPIQSSATLANDDSDSDDILFSSSIATRSQMAPESSRRNPFTSSAVETSYRVKRSPKKKEIVVDVNSSDPDDGSEDERQKPPQRSKTMPEKNGRISTLKSSPVIELSSDSEEEELPAQRKLIRGGRKPTTRPARTPDISSDEESDAIKSTQPARSKNQRTKHSDNDSSEAPITSPLKRTRPVMESSDDSDDSELASSPMKRRKPNSSATPESSKSDSRIGTPNRTTRQSRQRRHRSDREKAVELMKRRRAGENIEELTDTSESPDEAEESDFQKLSEFEDDEDEIVEEVISKRKKNSKQNADISPRSKGLDDYESDFVDSDGELGVPSNALLGIPLEFTHAAHKPLKAHFRDAIEWMVHKKLNPGFSRDDPIYRQAFTKLNDEYAGYAKSKFISTQWTADFIRAISARPVMTFRDLEPGEEIEIAGQVICQVCNHRKYVPKYQIQFLGKPYDKDSLDELERESDDEDDDDDASQDSDISEYNTAGQKIPPESRQWLSGQYCKANAEQAHSLLHWKWALNDWVVDTLKNGGELSAKKLAEREKMKPKQRRKYANGVVDDWEANEQIKDLYRDFKTNLETAREASHGGPWGGRGGRR